MAERTLYLTSSVSGNVSTPANALGTSDNTGTTDTGNTDWTHRWAFTPESTGSYQTSDHRFQARVQKDAGGGGDPTFTPVVYVNGASVTIVEHVATFPYSVANSAWGNVEWRVALADISPGDTVEVELVTEGGGGGPNARCVQLDAILWIADHTTGSTLQLTGSTTGTSSSSGYIFVVGEPEYTTPNVLSAVNEANTTDNITASLGTPTLTTGTSPADSSTYQLISTAGATETTRLTTVLKEVKNGDHVTITWWSKAVTIGQSINDFPGCYTADGWVAQHNKAITSGIEQNVWKRNRVNAVASQDAPVFRLHSYSSTSGDVFHFDSIEVDVPYSPNNLYQASVGNSIDPDGCDHGRLTGLTNQSGTTTFLSVSSDTPTLIEAPRGAFKSVRMNATGSAFERIELTEGFTLDTAKTYFVQFWYKRVAGATTAGNGMVFRVATADGTNGATDETDGAWEEITTANTGAWTQWTSSNWNPTETNPDIWVVGSWNDSTADDFYITNFEILEASVTTLQLTGSTTGTATTSGTLRRNILDGIAYSARFEDDPATNGGLLIDDLGIRNGVNSGSGASLTASGRDGNAWEFVSDGVAPDDYVQIDNTTGLHSLSAITVAVDFYPTTGGPGATANIFGLFRLELGTHVWNIGWNPSEQFRGRIIGTTAGQDIVTTSGPYALNTWHRAILRWEANGTVDLNINGNAKESSAGTVVDMDDPANTESRPIAFGMPDSYSGLSGRQLNGRVDNAMVWTRRLEDDEVTRLTTGESYPTVIELGLSPTPKLPLTGTATGTATTGTPNLIVRLDNYYDDNSAVHPVNDANSLGLANVVSGPGTVEVVSGITGSTGTYCFKVTQTETANGTVILMPFAGSNLLTSGRTYIISARIRSNSTDQNPFFYASSGEEWTEVNRVDTNFADDTWHERYFVATFNGWLNSNSGGIRLWHGADVTAGDVTYIDNLRIQDYTGVLDFDGGSATGQATTSGTLSTNDVYQGNVAAYDDGGTTTTLPASGTNANQFALNGGVSVSAVADAPAGIGGTHSLKVLSDGGANTYGTFYLGATVSQWYHLRVSIKVSSSAVPIRLAVYDQATGFTDVDTNITQRLGRSLIFTTKPEIILPGSM